MARKVEQETDVLMKVRHGGKAKVWIQEVCEVKDLGIIIITGVSERCLIYSQKKKCVFNKKNLDFSAIFVLDSQYGADMEEFVLGKSSVLPLLDDEILEVKSIVKATMEEWWDTEEAKTMIAENNRIQRNTQTKIDLKKLLEEKENLEKNLYSGLETVADMEKRIRDLQDIGKLLKGTPNV